MKDLIVSFVLPALISVVFYVGFTKSTNVTSHVAFHPCGVPCPANGPCCSRWGFCGSTELHCSRKFGCQSGCTEDDLFQENELARPVKGVTVPFQQQNRSMLLPWEQPIHPNEGWPEYVEDSAPAEKASTSRKFRKRDFDSPINGHNDENPYFDDRGLFSCCVPKGVISMTFDDGPSEITDSVLDILKGYVGVRATFFVVGKNVERRPELVRRIINEGHIVASHTWSHPDLTTLDDAAIGSEMTRTQDAIFKAAGVRPVYMRPPYGSMDNRVKKVLWSMGFKIILWNLDTNDWKYHQEDPGRIFKAFRNNFVKYKTARMARSWIPLQHDMYKGTLEQQKKIMELSYKMGYTFVSLNECLHDMESPYF